MAQILKEDQMRVAFRLLVTVCVLGAVVAVMRAQEVFQPGNGVSIPTVVSQVKPDYTPEAKAARIEGTVMLETVVLSDGSVGDVTVARSLDAALGLDQQAVKAMKQWTFNPGMKDGKTVAVRVRVEMTFTLK
jgi:periplasmic protein TonB